MQLKAETCLSQRAKMATRDTQLTACLGLSSAMKDFLEDVMDDQLEWHAAVA